jgi:hypothetical protein
MGGKDNYKVDRAAALYPDIVTMPSSPSSSSSAS